MKYELDREQIEALYTFADTFNYNDLYNMFIENMSGKDIYQLNCVLDSIYKTFQGKL